MKARDQILDAAGQLIHIQGYHATTVDQVVSASGLSKGTLYHHFSNKEILGQAVLDRFFADYGNRFEEAMRVHADPFRRLEALMDTMVEIQREIGLLGCPIGNLALELSCSHEGFRKRLQIMFERMTGEVEACLQRARSEGNLRAEVDAARAARFLVASMEGAVLLAKTERDVRIMAGCVEEAKAWLDTLRPFGFGGGAAS